MTFSPEQFIWILPLYFLLLFPAITWIIGRLSGWSFLAKVYPYRSPLPESKTWPTCSIPNLSMRNCIYVTLDSAGMYFQMIFIFRFGVPSIFIPWSDLTVSNSKYYFIPTSRITFKKANWIHFQFYRATTDKFAEYAGDRWPDEKTHL